MKDIESTWWSLFQKRVVRSKLHIYDFIFKQITASVVITASAVITASVVITPLLCVDKHAGLECEKYSNQTL